MFPNLEQVFVIFFSPTTLVCMSDIVGTHFYCNTGYMQRELQRLLCKWKFEFDSHLL